MYLKTQSGEYPVLVYFDSETCSYTSISKKNHGTSNDFLKSLMNLIKDEKKVDAPMAPLFSWYVA